MTETERADSRSGCFHDEGRSNSPLHGAPIKSRGYNTLDVWGAVESSSYRRRANSLGRSVLNRTEPTLDARIRWRIPAGRVPMQPELLSCASQPV